MTEDFPYSYKKEVDVETVADLTKKLIDFLSTVEGYSMSPNEREGNKYLNRKGEPISEKLWNILFDNLSYRKVRSHTLKDGTYISTVWLGANCSINPKYPLIFETLVERDNGQYFYRYSTEAEAIKCHYRLVLKYKKRINQLRRFKPKKPKGETI